MSKPKKYPLRADAPAPSGENLRAREIESEVGRYHAGSIRTQAGAYTMASAAFSLVAEALGGNLTKLAGWDGTWGGVSGTKVQAAINALKVTAGELDVKYQKVSDAIWDFQDSIDNQYARLKKIATNTEETEQTTAGSYAPYPGYSSDNPDYKIEYEKVPYNESRAADLEAQQILRELNTQIKSAYDATPASLDVNIPDINLNGDDDPNAPQQRPDVGGNLASSTSSGADLSGNRADYDGGSDGSTGSDGSGGPDGSDGSPGSDGPTGQDPGAGQDPQPPGGQDGTGPGDGTGDNPGENGVNPDETKLSDFAGPPPGSTPPSVIGSIPPGGTGTGFVPPTSGIGPPRIPGGGVGGSSPFGVGGVAPGLLGNAGLGRGGAGMMGMPFMPMGGAGMGNDGQDREREIYDPENEFGPDEEHVSNPLLG